MTPPRWTELTAVFGGVFDPPHAGHLEAVRGLFRDPGVARVLIMPAPSPAYKPCHASVADRLEMTRLNFNQGLPADSVEVSLVELERAQKFPGRSTYTYDTLGELGKDHSNLAFVVGADQLNQMASWYRFPEVLDLGHWIILARQPNGLETAMRTLGEWESGGLARKVPGSPDAVHGVWQLRQGKRFLRLTPTSAPALSSTEIREILAKTGSAPEGSLTPQITTYLKQKRLYGSKGFEDKSR